MRIQNLTNEQANYWCAKAQGLVKISEFCYKDKDGNTVLDGTPCTPTTNPAQWGGLIERFAMSVGSVRPDWWEATAWNDETSYERYGPTPGRAVVNAVIASVYGDEVPEVEA